MIQRVQVQLQEIIESRRRNDDNSTKKSVTKCRMEIVKFLSKIFIFVIDLGSFSSLLQSALPKCVLELNVDGVTTAEHLMTINLIPAEILN